MNVKAIEIRDRGTFIPAFAVLTTWANEGQRWLLARAGFKNVADAIFLVKMCSGEAHNDPYDWGDRTMQGAHDYIQKHFHELHDGSVVDVEFILGESARPKESERVTYPMAEAVPLDYAKRDIGQDLP